MQKRIIRQIAFHIQRPSTIQHEATTDREAANRQVMNTEMQSERLSVIIYKYYLNTQINAHQSLKSVHPSTIVIDYRLLLHLESMH